MLTRQYYMLNGTVLLPLSGAAVFGEASRVQHRIDRLFPRPTPAAPSPRAGAP